MGSFRFIAPLALVTAFVTSACGNKTPDGTSGPSASSSANGPGAEFPEAPPSPFSVVLESAKPIVFDGLGSGIAATNASHSLLATQIGGAEINLAPMPEGLPDIGSVIRFQGKLPGSLWLSFETPAEEKASPKHPLFRLDIRKKAWKKWTDDWKPLLTPWSNNRVLSMSTSSGKLKIKVVEPYRDKLEADWPSSRLGDEACEKSLRLEGLTALPSGDVFGAGHCKTGGNARKYVLVQWPVATAAPATSASSRPAPVPPASVAAAPPNPSASAMPENDAPSPEIADAGAPDAGEAVAPDIGVHGVLFAITDSSARIDHRDLVAGAGNDVWILAATGDGAVLLHRFDGKSVIAEEPPKPLDGEGRAVAVSDDGVIWFVSTRAIWKRAATGAWEKVPPPSGHWREADPKWEFSKVWAAKGDVWIAGKHTSAKGEHHVVLRLRAGKETITMP
jgi:hypothetical protein